MRTSTHPTWQTEAAMSHFWLRAALFIPLGYAVSRTISAQPPVLPLVALAAAAACLHKLVPWLVEVVAGAAGLVLGVFAATETSGSGSYGKLLGQPGTVVVLGFGGVVMTSAFVRLLGCGSVREAAKHLVAGAAALELGLVLLSPLGRSLLHAEDETTRAIVLATLLLGCTIVAIRSRLGFPLLGLGLLVAMGVFAVTGTAGATSPGRMVLGSVTFALVALWLHDADSPGVVHPGWAHDSLAEAA